MLKRVTQVLQYLSIDILIGAVILLRFFSKRAEVQVELPVYIILASVVWLIYTFDHLKDANDAPHSLRGRYRFHLAFRNPIVSLMWVVLTTALILVFFVPSTLILSGLILFVFCVSYFLFQKQLAFWGLKEACIALMYTSGILLVPTVYTRIFDVTSFLLLFVLASLNLIIFSWMEMESDQRDGFDSIATRFGKLFTEKLILSVLAIGLTLSISSLQTDLYLSIYFMVSFSLYGVIVWVPGWFSLKERYRVLGDGVFILPLFFEFI